MQRIDIFLVEHGLAESREQAKRLILAGAVTVNGNTRIKPGQRVSADAKIVVQAPQRYVSRGGFKLEKALSLFDVDVENRVALDVGASTGGFTDCLLQHGAKFVYAVDVGYGQLAWKLRTHPQVQSIEKTNIRHLTPTHLKTSALNDSEDFISIAVIDVSFISLRTVLPSVIKILTQQTKKLSVISCQLSVKEGDDDASVLSDNRKVFRRKTELATDNHPYDIIALLKPQFEAGKAHVKKGGIVPDKQVHIQTIDNLSAFVTEKLGATVRGLTYSPIHKDIGNIEYLLWLTIELDTQASALGTDVHRQQTTAEVVAAAHELF
ncbi:TlyA family RNA methyltransferase [Candidatus Poribacteria bacterium]|nr:TlyA family RNA methyltransferase [Candidatus Poribacteria bacterium]